MPGGIANASRLTNVLNILVNQFHEIDGLIARLSEVNQCIANGLLGSTRRFELETLQAGQVQDSPIFIFLVRHPPRHPISGTQDLIQGSI